MANQLVKDMEKQAAAAPAPPTDEQLRTELMNEREARMRAENERAQLQIAAQQEWNGRREAERKLNELRTPRPDPFAVLAEEGVAATPERHRDLLDAGVRDRAREEMDRRERERDQRDAQREQQRETQQALTMFAAMNPTVVGDDEGFYGAMGKAQLRAQKQGLRLAPLQLLELGKSIYYEDRTARGLPGAVPFTEGASIPGAPGVPGKEPKTDEKVQNMLEGYYGLEAGTLHPDGGEYSMDDHTRDWIDTRNLALNDTEKFSSSIRQVRGTLEEGKQRRRASTAGR